jgi:hypothetical protein
MIGIERQVGSSVVRGRFCGDLSRSDLVAFVLSLRDLREGEMRIRILLDWTEIERWKAGTAHPSLWRDLPESIDRAAIVHQHRWDRQAAVLAAMMRMNQTSVRSWAPSSATAAMAWLMEEGS